MPALMIWSMGLPSNSSPFHWMEPEEAFDQTADGTQSGGFSGTVDADEGHDLAVGHLQGNAPQGLNAAVADMEIFNLKHLLPPPGTRQ